jgi:hypothetical protein
MRAVGDDRRVCELDPQLEQAFGQPRPVAVAHATAQHLRAGHHDPGAQRLAHAHVGSRPGASGRRPFAFVIE